MPRGPRLDAPGALHHVMVRRIEGRALAPALHMPREAVYAVARLHAVGKKLK